MMKPTPKKPPGGQRGFTLIELLLYMAILTVLLTAVSLFLTTTLSARIKNQSIAEVDQQGTAVLEQISQAIRGADSVTTPTAGASGDTLSLAMPTAGVNPTLFDVSGTSTIMGYATDGGATDTSNSNNINITRFTAGATGTISTLSAFIGPTVAAAPNNKGQMAIYSGTTSAPTALLASSSETTLSANTWNSFSISPISVTSGQIYWLGYNTNGTAISHNNMRYHTTGANQSLYTARAYGTWPASWSAGTSSNFEFSVYASIVTSGGTVPALQIKEGAGAVVPLTNDNVAVSGLTFKNLSRSGTPGVVQVSFTISRVNTNGRNEFEYQKTFTTTVALR
jgi:prepilin-type N-terminal cleavage/methylation domain-containing protein